ncbi:MAG: site-specific integrase [Atopobiaceae bacterium]|nr:site-specific integrase [Atopobiaceae bacterium]
MRAQLEEEHEQAQFVTRTTMTVGEYVEGYINRLDETKVLERSTVNGYLCMLGYIRDGLDKVRLTQLSAAQVQAWEAKLLTDGLSATTVRKAHMLLKSALKYARRRNREPELRRALEGAGVELYV